MLLVIYSVCAFRSLKIFSDLKAHTIDTEGCISLYRTRGDSNYHGKPFHHDFHHDSFKVYEIVCGVTLGMTDH